jgi:hypothetical protein
MADWHFSVAVPIAVEIRNKTWLTDKLAGCLRAHGAVWALADQAWVPSPLSLLKKLDVVTGRFAYERLLGDRAEVDKLTKRWTIPSSTGETRLEPMPRQSAN